MEPETLIHLSGAVRDGLPPCVSASVITAFVNTPHPCSPSAAARRQSSITFAFASSMVSCPVAAGWQGGPGRVPHSSCT
eukprot:1620780-Prymnesium_polylepis.1